MLMVAGMSNDGMTIFLTTHYIEEAESLCTRVSFIEKGKIIAEFKAKYADRLSPDGGYALTVATGGDSATGKAYVEVDLETTAFKSTVARNNAPAK